SSASRLVSDSVYPAGFWKLGMMCASFSRVAESPSSSAASACVSIPSCCNSTACTCAPRSVSESSVRSYVGRSTTTSSPLLTSCSNRNASACIDPLVTSTRSGSTPCLSAIQARSRGYPIEVPYAVVPAGSLSNARAAASLRPCTSTMSSDGAPRAKEIMGDILCWRLRRQQSAALVDQILHRAAQLLLEAIQLRHLERLGHRRRLRQRCMRVCRAWRVRRWVLRVVRRGRGLRGWNVPLHVRVRRVWCVGSGGHVRRAGRKLRNTP